MKDKIFYAFEGMITGLITYHVWQDVVIPILVSGVCAVITVIIQHFLKKYLAKREANAARYRQNGKH